MDVTGKLTTYSDEYSSLTSRCPIVIKHGSSHGGKFGRREKIVVIGAGRFGNALVQGICQSHVHYETSSGITMIPTEVYQVPARQFLTQNAGEMANTFQDAKYIVYSGTHLTKNSTKIAAAMKIAKNNQKGSSITEFIDFSNPDPHSEKNDVPGAVKLWSKLIYGQDKNHGWKLWKITECGLLDVAGIEEPNNDYAKVYGAGIQKHEVPQLRITGLRWRPALYDRHDLFAEVYDRMMERADVDRWYDAFILGLAVWFTTAVYAITRFSVSFNGNYPWSMVPLFILDKSVAWTGLWMLIISPFAGNLLALQGVLKKCGKIGYIDYLVFFIGTALMIFPTLEFVIPFFLWFILRTLFFSWISGKGINLYEHQEATKKLDGIKQYSFVKAMLIDMVSLKGETGCTGFFFAIAHTFMGFICADPAYRPKWFDKETGRLFWNYEVCLATGCWATAILLFVTLRSLFGKASLIRLKPLYAYASPIGMWLATAHVVFWGYSGWYKLFQYKYQNGQPSISFMSSMFPMGVLLVNLIMACSGTKTRLVSGGMYLWKHSAVRIAKEEFITLKNKYAGAETTAIINVVKSVPSTVISTSDIEMPSKVGNTSELDASLLWGNTQRRSTMSFTQVSDDEVSV